MENVSILWDIENVTPSTDSLFIEGLSEYAESLGRIVSARAYCDWSKPAYRKMGPYLSRFHYYLVQVPRERNQKNSADINLITDALELLRLYEHIDTFILVTGDSDFRALVLALRRAGKRIHIICDLKKASQDLLVLADSFKDYREVIPGGDEDTAHSSSISGTDQGRGEQPVASVPREHWFEILTDATRIILKENKNPNMSAVKIRMRMLNPNFSEKELGYRSWSDFVGEAVKAGYVKIEGRDRQAMILPAERDISLKSAQQQALDTLLDIIGGLDGGKDPVFHDFATVNALLGKKGVDFKKLGFRQFKSFIQAAETRGLLESKAEGLRHFLRRVKQIKSQQIKRSRRR